MTTRLEKAQGQLHNMQQRHTEVVAAKENEMQVLQTELEEKQTKLNDLQEKFYAMESSFNTEAEKMVGLVAQAKTSLTEAQSQYATAFQEAKAQEEAEAQKEVAAARSHAGESGVRL